MTSNTYESQRDPALKIGFAIFMAVAIAAIGYIMMTIGSSPTVKGASFMWLPAALQLVAGIWLGPIYGTLAAAAGAYAAGILAYGGWGIVDIIMNPLAGGVANALLPWALFKIMNIDATLGTDKAGDVLKGAVRILILTALVLAAGLANIVLNLPSPWGFATPLIVLAVGAFVLLRDVKMDQRHFLPAIFVAVFACLVSALIGAIGATVGGKPFGAALVDPGIGWFAGDTVSAILGLFLLPLYTTRLREAGIAEGAPASQSGDGSAAGKASGMPTNDYESQRDPSLKIGFAIFMAVAIAAIGYIMMTIGSSPTVKGASFMWLPAALQLVAGIWLGPIYGTLAAAAGAYAAGILAYGGWGIVDIIMNPLAGGVANALLPWVLFKMMKIDATLGTGKPGDVLKGAVRILVLTALVLAAGLANIFLNLPSPWGFITPLIVLGAGAYVLLRDVQIDSRHFLPAIFVAVFVCLVSALIGAVGATVGGKPFGAALIDPGIGWFAGDTVSAILGLFLLPLYTTRLREAGIAQ